MEKGDEVKQPSRSLYSHSLQVTFKWDKINLQFPLFPFSASRKGLLNILGWEQKRKARDIIFSGNCGMEEVSVNSAFGVF